MNKILNLSENEAMTELIDEVYSKRPSFRIKLIKPSNNPEKNKTESKITEELMENTKEIMNIMNLLEPEVHPVLTQQASVNTPEQSIIFQQVPVLKSISEQPSLSQKVSVLRTIPEQSTRFMPRRKLDDSTKITEHYETLIPLNLGRIKNFREEEKIDFGSLAQNVNQKVFFGETPSTLTRNISPEPTHLVKNGKIEPEAELKQEPSLVDQRYSSSLHSEPVESFDFHRVDLNPTYAKIVTDSFKKQDLIQNNPGADSKYVEEYYYPSKVSISDYSARNLDLVNLGENDPPVNPTGSISPVYPTEINSPVYPGSSSPVYPTGSSSQFYPTGSSSPVYTSKSNSPVYPTESNSPVYPTGSNSPVYPTGSRSNVYPTEISSPVYPTGTNSPVYPTGTTSPVYPTGTTSPVYPTGNTSPVYSTRTNSPVYKYETQVNSGCILTFEFSHICFNF